MQFLKLSTAWSWHWALHLNSVCSISKQNHIILISMHHPVVAALLPCTSTRLRFMREVCYRALGSCTGYQWLGTLICRLLSIGYWIQLLQGTGYRWWLPMNEYFNIQITGYWVQLLVYGFWVLLLQGTAWLPMTGYCKYWVQGTGYRYWVLRQEPCVIYCTVHIPHIPVV